MDVLDKQYALKLVSTFSSAVKGMAFYPASHPAIRQPLLEFDRLISSTLLQSPELKWGVIDGIMYMEDHMFVTPSAPVAEMGDLLVRKKIGALVFSAGIDLEEIQSFLSLLTTSKTISELQKEMSSLNIRHIRLFSESEALVAEERDDNGDDDDEGDYTVTYRRAVDAIRNICRDIERGRIPNCAPVIRVVDRMVGITLTDPSTLLGLTMIKDYDNYTYNHCVNVGVLAMALGASIGMNSESVKELGIAGQLHDIGKTLISKDIVNKPGKLSAAEFEAIKKHSELGAKIIREIDGLGPHIAQIVLGHHLHRNRSGYPEWARKLPFSSMIDIVAIADTYDALTTLRVYQHPVNPRDALREMQKMTGTILDDNLMSSFIELMGKYPVGTLVRLDSNEVAVIHRPNPLDQEAPIVRVLFDQDGNRLETPREQHLVDSDGTWHARIVAVVDPLLKNVDVGRYLTDAF